MMTMILIGQMNVRHDEVPKCSILRVDHPVLAWARANKAWANSLVKALQTAQQNFVITDPSLPDNPIVFASQGFLTLTGYALESVLGRNCRFLQGPRTDPRAVAKIRKAVDEGYDTSVCLLNYRIDGSTFYNQIGRAHV